MVANSIAARHVSVSEVLVANQVQLGGGVVNGDLHIERGTIYSGHIVNMTFDKLAGGLLGPQFLQVGGTYGIGRSCIEIEGRFGYHALRYKDQNQITRVEIGQNAPTPDANRDGLIVRGIDGRVILHANGLGVQIAGTDQILNRSITNLHYVKGDYNLSFIASQSYQNYPNHFMMTVESPAAAQYLQRITINGQAIIEFGYNANDPVKPSFLANYIHQMPLASAAFGCVIKTQSLVQDIASSDPARPSYWYDNDYLHSLSANVQGSSWPYFKANTTLSVLEILR
jgi:hypothetical protein